MPTCADPSSGSEIGFRGGVVQSDLLRVSRWIALGAALLLATTGQALAALGASVTLVSGDPTNIAPGATTRLEITLSNSSESADITGVAFSNSLPGTLSTVSPIRVR